MHLRPNNRTADLPRDDAFQYRVIDGIEKSPHVAFKSIAWSSVIPSHFSCHHFESSDRPMSSLSYPTRVRIVDKHRFESVRKGVVRSLMDDPVAHAGFVDVTAFRVVDEKIGILAVDVISFREVAVQVENGLLRVDSKLCDVLFSRFSTTE